MKARIQSWEIKELGPAFQTRREEPDGSVSFDSMNDLSLRIRIIGGDDAQKFLDMIKQLEKGASINRIDIQTRGNQDARTMRKYVFT